MAQVQVLALELAAAVAVDGPVEGFLMAPDLVPKPEAVVSGMAQVMAMAQEQESVWELAALAQALVAGCWCLLFPAGAPQVLAPQLAPAQGRAAMQAAR
jgi:hypothetical protein